MSRLLHTRMDLELLNSIDMDMKWNVRKKGRTNITRRPRTDDFELGNGIQEPDAFETKKTSTENIVVDASLKKRRLLHQSPSPPAQTLFLIGEGVLSAGPPTPTVYHEDSGQRCRSNSLSQSQKTKSKTRLRNNNLLKPTKNEVFDLGDFSGIELLAAAACSSFIHDNADHAEDFSLLKQHTTSPGVNSCDVDLDASAIQDSMIQDTQNPHDNGKEREEEKGAPSKGLRLHWDLNTVMDEWEEPCDDLTVEPQSHENSSVKLHVQGHESRCVEVVAAEERKMVDSVYTAQLSVKHDAAISVAPLVESCNGNSCGERYESIEDLTCSQEALGTKMSKTSEGESSVTVSKSDVVDSLIHPGKCEDLTTSTNSTTSVLREQIILKVEADTMLKLDQQPVSEEVIQGVCQSLNLCKSYFDNKVTSENPVSECRGLDVTRDKQGQMPEGDSEDKVQVGYDSPFEDGEFREPIENPLSGRETIYYESDNISKDDFGTIENPLSDKVEASSEIGQTQESQSSLLVKVITPNNDTEQSSQADTFERRHIDELGQVLSERRAGLDESRPVGGNVLHIGVSTSLDVCRNGSYERQSRSSNSGDYNCRSVRDLSVEKYMGRDKGSFPDCSRNNISGPCVDSSLRVWELKSCHEYQRPKNVTRNYDPRDSYRRENRRSSPSERNNGYGSNRGPQATNRSRDRYRGGSGFHPQDYHDPKTSYIERKPRFFPNSKRPSTRSRSRSRSGSPIAWHFQKRKNLDTSDSGEVEALTRGHVSPERSSKCFNDRRFRDDRFRDKRQSPPIITQRNQRFDSIGCPERLKFDDHFRFTQRSARFSQMTGHRYKDNNDALRKHDDPYKKVTCVGRPDDDASGVRRFRYAVEHRNLDNFSGDTRNEHTPVISESKS